MEGQNYVLVGLRHVGKSYLMYQRISELIGQGRQVEEILYFNFEDDRIGPMTSQDLDLIKTCRGVVVLAHPSVYHSMELARELIAAGRLDGVEVYHPRNTPEDKAELLQLAREHDLIVTGGTDFHGLNTNTPRPIGTFYTQDEMIQRIADTAKARKATLRRS